MNEHKRKNDNFNGAFTYTEGSSLLTITPNEIVQLKANLLYSYESSCQENLLSVTSIKESYQGSIILGKLSVELVTKKIILSDHGHFYTRFGELRVRFMNLPDKRGGSFFYHKGCNDYEWLRPLSES